LVVAGVVVAIGSVPIRSVAVAVAVAGCFDIHS
jgi:hypothetical protein